MVMPGIDVFGISVQFVMEVLALTAISFGHERSSAGLIVPEGNERIIREFLSL